MEKLNEFLKKFLTEYEQQFNNFTKKEVEKGIQAGITLSFLLNKFPDALQNCIDKICERQRENCAKEAFVLYEYGTAFVDEDSILCAEQPKIEEL